MTWSSFVERCSKDERQGFGVPRKGLFPTLGINSREGF